MHICDKLLDDRRRGVAKKKIRVIPNKAAVSTTPVSFEIENAEKPKNNDTDSEEISLTRGKLEYLLSSVRETLAKEAYVEFKKLLARFSKADVATVALKLSELFTGSERSRMIFRAFVRFFKDKTKAEEFSKKCEEYTGRRPVGY